MPFFRRPDGVLVKGENPIHKLMPFIMTRRNESIVFLEQQIDVTNLLSYIEKTNAARPPERKVSFFPIALCAMARAMGLRPKMNRFVVGRRIYQRNRMEYSFGVKKKFQDEALLTMVKLPFEVTDTIDTVTERIQAAINKGRSEKLTSSEKEMVLVTALPRFLLRFIVWALKALDYFNLMPASMIRSDELYASMVIANLGSVGLEAPYHHLYEWGTAPLFGVIGKIEKTPKVDANGQLVFRDMVSFKWSFDERIADGFYCARSLDLFKGFLADPSQLEKPPASSSEVVIGEAGEGGSMQDAVGF